MRAFIEVHLKLIVTIWIILVSVLGLLVFMNAIKFSNLMSSVVSSQLQVMAGSLERSIVQSEKLGLPLREMNTLPGLLLKAQQRDENITNIAVISQQGEVLFTLTQPTWQGTPEQPALLRRALKSSEPAWLMEQDEVLYSGLQLFDGTGQMIGSIVIDYDKYSYTSAVVQMRNRLLLMTALVFIGFASLIFIAVWLGLGDVKNVFALIQGQLNDSDDSPKKHARGVLVKQFAEQIELSRKVKGELGQELDSLLVDSKVATRGASNE